MRDCVVVHGRVQLYAVVYGCMQLHAHVHADAVVCVIAWLCARMRSCVWLCGCAICNMLLP